jgi:predicted TIM-barrel fold metal-dependent hydrolase
MNQNRPIVDPHQHFWKLGNLHYPWLMDSHESEFGQSHSGLIDFVKSQPDLTNDYLVANLRDDARDLNLVKTVHVEAVPSLDDSVAETQWLSELAGANENQGLPNGIVASVDLARSDFTEKLNQHMQYPNLRGVRQILNWISEPLMLDESWRKNYSQLEALDLIFDMQIEPPQMADAAKLAADFPGIHIALNHTGLPDLDIDDGIEAWRKGMALLAQNENVKVKLSGFGMLGPSFSTEFIRPFVLESIDLFGVSRCMFASNFPVDRLYVSYHDLWTSFMEVTEDFSEEEKSCLFYDNACSLYRL